jgi:hypothetical protein
MGRETIIGILLGVFGLAGGAAVSALLMLYPQWAGPVLYVSLAVCALCVIAAPVVIFWGVKKQRRQAMKVGKDSVVMGNVPADAEIGEGCTIIGATDALGNTTLNTTMAVGKGAYAGPGGIAIGTGAGAAGAPEKDD